MELDEVDLRLLELLAENSRTSFAELSRELGIPRTTLIGRVEKLRREGVIKSFTLDLDFKRLGYKYLAFVLIKARRGMGSAPLPSQVLLAERIHRGSAEREDLPWVEESHVITGEYDILLKIRARKWEDVTKFLIEFLAGFEEIEHTNTALVLTTVREERRPPAVGGAKRG